MIIMGAWGFYSTYPEGKTAAIPIIIGVVLLVLNNGVKYENKVQAHIAVVLTLLGVFGVAKAFMGQLDEGDTLGIIRTGAMILTGIIAMIAFIKSFRDARKNRA